MFGFGKGEQIKAAYKEAETRNRRCELDAAQRLRNERPVQTAWPWPGSHMGAQLGAPVVIPSGRVGATRTGEASDAAIVSDSRGHIPTSMAQAHWNLLEKGYEAVKVTITRSNNTFPDDPGYKVTQEPILVYKDTKDWKPGCEPTQEDLDKLASNFVRGLEQFNGGKRVNT